MAIVPTGAIYKSLVFDGESSRDYGIYITGQAVYNAPERDVEMINVPGRNGSFALDKGRFQNIEVTYPAGIFADTETDFAQGISDFRNFLCSRNGYVRLTDEYNPNEYRMAVYKSGLDVSPAQLKAGEFNITFDCKPQRYLTSGEDPVTIGEWHETETASGSIASFEAVDGDGVKSLVVDIEPMQSGSGTPSPTNIRPISGYDSVVVNRCGRNLLPPWTSLTLSGVTFDIASDGSIIANGENQTGYNQAIGTKAITLPSGTYTVSGGGSLPIRVEVFNVTKNETYRESGAKTFTYNGTDFLQALIYVQKNVAMDNVILRPQIEPGSSVSAYEPYQSYATYTTDLSGTRYGGALDVGSGVLTVTDAYIASYAGESLPSTWISDRDVYESGTTPTTGAQVVYRLATPTIVQLTAQEVELLVGLNQIWANSGDVEVEYGTAPNVLINPTLFESSPMLEVEGYGSIGFNGYEIRLQDAVMGEVPLADRKSSPHLLRTTLQLAALNDGDTITVQGVTVKSDIISTLVTITSVSNSNNSFTTTYKTGVAYGYPAYLFTTSIGSLTAQKGSDETIDNTLTVAYTYNGTAYTTTLDISIKFLQTSVNEMDFEVRVTGEGYIFERPTMTSDERVHGRIVGYSSASILGNPTYIDCNIGECYMIKNGDPVSLNRYIDLGSDLPKLVSGANTITADNTVTDLKVVPRWWKI